MAYEANIICYDNVLTTKKEKTMPYGAHQGGKKPEKGMHKKPGKKLAGTAYGKPEKPMKPRK